jgi:DNA gyrase subunit A
VSVLGRNTQGVTLIKVQEGEKLVQVARVAETIEERSEEIVEEIINEVSEGSVEQSTPESSENSHQSDTDEASSAADAPEQE